jgi:hypothetical protein
MSPEVGGRNGANSVGTCRIEAIIAEWTHTPWTVETVKAGLSRFYRGVTGLHRALGF